MADRPIDVSPAVAWPPIDGEVLDAVMEQLRTTTSIYDGSGIFAEFESAFAKLHGLEYALTVSSGTAALHSAFYALGLGPGDEVICPTYTFFSTAAPLLQLGAQPVLVDCTPDGTFDYLSAAALLTERTRALVLSHMWGRPEDVLTARDFCNTRGLFLIEDCSHAHGASFRGVPVGSLADAAAWSLQANKSLPAGEGGVFGTNSSDVFEKALLLGHFNKRCLREIPTLSPNYPWAETGLGLKYRAHPLGIAMANVFLKRLPTYLKARDQNAARIRSYLNADFIRDIRGSSCRGHSRDSYYSFVMLLDENLSMTPTALVSELSRGGFTFADVPRGIRPLHEFPLFRSPISPVFDYDRPCLRTNYPNASALGARSIKCPVPHLDGPIAQEYCVRFGIALSCALDQAKEN